jgi:hypothetical protein
MDILKKKISRFSGKTWCGYITPMETLLLKREGACIKPEDLIWAKEQKISGMSSPKWVYFDLKRPL